MRSGRDPHAFSHGRVPLRGGASRRLCGTGGSWRDPSGAETARGSARSSAARGGSASTRPRPRSACGAVSEGHCGAPAAAVTSRRAQSGACTPQRSVAAQLASFFSFCLHLFISSFLSFLLSSFLFFFPSFLLSLPPSPPPSLPSFLPTFLPSYLPLSLSLFFFPSFPHFFSFSIFLSLCLSSPSLSSLSSLPFFSFFSPQCHFLTHCHT